MKDADNLKQQGMTPPPPAPIVVNGQQPQPDSMDLLTNALANVAAATYLSVFWCCCLIV